MQTPNKRIRHYFFVILFMGSLSLPAYAASTIETIGNVGQYAVPLTGLLVAAEHKDKQGVWQLAKSYSTALAVTYLLKISVNRRRPDGGSWSFPSGHSASAFAGAAFLQQRYGWQYGAPAYAAAWFVGLSRIYAQRHWPTDVFAGAAIGIGANLIFTRRYHTVVYPVVTSHSVGIGFQAGI